jgi:hypothetical protein
MAHPHIKDDVMEIGQGSLCWLVIKIASARLILDGLNH